MAVRAVDERPGMDRGPAHNEGPPSGLPRHRLAVLVIALTLALAAAGAIAAGSGAGRHRGHTPSGSIVPRGELLKLQARVAADAPRLRADGIQLLSWSDGIRTDDRENITVRNLTSAQERTLDRMFGTRDIRLIAVGGIRSAGPSAR